MIKLPYYKELVQIRDLLEDCPGFPRKWCGPTTALVSKVTGLKKAAGYYIPSPGSSFYERGKQMHAWNVDNEKWLYIDLSLDQFHKRSRKIWALPVSTRVLRENLDVMEEYRKVCKKDSFTERLEILCRLYEERYGKICPKIGAKSSD